MKTIQGSKEQLEKIERSLLELGTEVYCLRSEISAIKSSHETLLDVIKGLKLILDEKGLINLEDFENAVELGNALASSLEQSIQNNFERMKKTGH